MPYKKATIPKPIKMEIWRIHCGETFEHACCISFCNNRMTPFDFEAGHIQAEAEGGEVSVENLIPICSKCNKSMGKKHLREWEQEHVPDREVCSAVCHKVLGTSRYERFKAFEADQSDYRRYKEKKEKQKKTIYGRMKAMIKQ